MDAFFKKIGGKKIGNFGDTKNTDLEMENENLEFQNYNLDFVGLKIENCQYLNFGHTKNKNLRNECGY